jgi:prepilin signal peptidase PulO-like enzyme (type II secretory pathway)
MTPSFKVIGLAVGLSILMAVIAVWVPKRLLREIGLPPLSSRVQIGLSGAVIAASLASTLVLPTIQGAGSVASVLLAGALVGIVYYDGRYQIIPDVLTAAVAISAGLTLWQDQQWMAHLFGAALCGGLMALVARVWKRTKGLDGLGFGDVKLMAALGLLLGPERGLWVLSSAALAGAVWGLALQRLRGRDQEPPQAPIKIPLGLFLALAGGVFVFGGLA